MPGPDPSPTRARRNAASNASVRAVLPAGGRVGRPPKLPSWVPDSEPWLVELWKRWWTSPQATQWDSKLHVPILGRLLAMYAEEAAMPDTKRSAECRQIEQQMGLTPKGMKDLGWVVEDAPEAGKKTAKKTAKAGDDPRAVLRAV